MNVREVTDKLEHRNACIGVLGLGYVGLPLATAFAKAGFKVVGYDPDNMKIQALQKQQVYLQHLNFDEIWPLINSALIPTSNPDNLDTCDVFVICVPTPLTAAQDPDLSYVIDAAAIVGQYLKPQSLVVLESTTYPGTTRGILKKTINAYSGLVGGEDYFLAFSPEREDPGNASYGLTNTPKVVGGIDKVSTEVAQRLYSTICTAVVAVTSTDVAEITKVFENVYRSVNIALVNELKLLCHKMGLDVWEVLSAAATKPFGFTKFNPGAGVGGHCAKGCELLTIINRQDKIKTDTIENFYAYYSKKSNTEEVSPGVFVAHTHGLQILSWDVVAKELVWKPLTHMFKREGEFDALVLECGDDERLTVTDGHPVFDVAQSPWKVIAAADLKLGDKIPQVDCGVMLQDRHAALELARRSYSYNLAKITNIRKQKLSEVYSVEVADTNTFVTSYGFVIHNCIPLDPFYLSWRAREFGMRTKFIELAGEINSAMPAYVFSRVQHALNKINKSVSGSNILVLGVAYKKNIGDVRESPSLPVLQQLDDEHANTFWYDPYVDPKFVPHGVRWTSLAQPDVFDCVVILTAHDCIDYAAFVKSGRMIVDTSGIVDRGYARLVPA